MTLLNGAPVTDAEIGAEFERDIGRRYEAQGWTVWYRGIERGKGDLGIDLVATKGDRQMLIQCKCWTRRETIPHVEIERFAEACRKYIGRRVIKGIELLPGLAPPRTYGMAYITTAQFSQPAIEAAQTRGVALRAGMPVPGFGPRFAMRQTPRPRETEPEPRRPEFELPEGTPHSAVTDPAPQ